MANQGFDSRDIIGMFGALYEERLASSWFTELSLYNGKSDRAVEEYGIFGGYPEMREWIGERQLQTVSKKIYEIRNRPFESSLPIKQVDLRRDHSGMLEGYIGGYAEEVVAGHWEDLGIELLNANGICYDESNFIAADHSFDGETAQTNELTATQCPRLNVTTATDPTPEEAARALLQVIGYMRGFRNNKNKSMNKNAKHFQVLVQTVELEAALIEAVSANMLSGMVTNPLTGLKMDNLKIDVRREPDLTGDDIASQMYVFRKDGKLKPFLRQDEQAIEFNVLDESSDHYKLKKEFVLLLDAIRGAGYGLWQHAARATFN